MLLLKTNTLKMTIVKYNKQLWISLFGIADRNLLMTEEGIYSITRPPVAKSFVSTIIRFLNDNKITVRNVVDSTTGLGGMARYLCDAFYNVTCVEKNKEHFNISMSNIHILCKKQPLFVNDSCLNFIKNVGNVDMIVCDPPWGGKDYIYNTNNSLYLDSQNICHVINDIFNDGICKVFVLLIMYNFNFLDLDIIDRSISITMYDSPHKVKLLIFHKL